MADTANTPDTAAEFWTADDCAAYINVARNTWHRYYKRPGVLNPTPQPTRYIGRTPVWSPHEVIAWAERRYRAVNS